MRRSIFSPRLAAGIALLTLVASAWQAPRHAAIAQQATSWSAPLQISQTDGNSWFPDAIVDKTGQVHVVWSSHAEGYDSVMYRSLLPDQRWTAQIDVFAEYVRDRLLQEATRPALALDSMGNLLLTNRVEDIYFSKVPANLAGNVSAWTEPMALNTDSVSYFSRLIVDGKDHYHLFLTQNVMTPDCTVCMQLFYRRSEDHGKTWTAVQNISMDANGVAKPQVVIDDRDNIHVIWEAGPAGGTLGHVLAPISVYYTSSVDDGETWNTPIALGRGVEAEQYRFPAIGIDGSGNLVVALLKAPEDAVYYLISQDGGKNWSAPTRIPGLYGILGVRENRLDTFSMAADSGGNLHLVLAGRVSPEQRQIGLYHTAWNGRDWSQPETIHQPSSAAPVWPRVTVGLGNRLHVVYTLNSTANLFNDGDEGARLDIYYAQADVQAPLNAPAIAPIVYPTMTPAPTAEPAQPVITPTVPVITNRTPGHVDYQNLRTEVDDYGMFFFSGLPVVLIFIAGYFILRRRRA